MMRRIVFNLIVLVYLAGRCDAGSQCCKGVVRLDEPPLIAALPPDEFEGEPRWIPNPVQSQPLEWDTADDGPWEAALIPNPAYAWAPHQVPNPRFRPAPTFLEELVAEVLKAAPWVALGIAVA